MYKTAIITDEISQDIQTAARLAVEYQLDALEIRSVNGKNPFELTLQDYANIHSVAADSGLAIAAISSPLFKCDLTDPNQVMAHIDGLKHCIEAAALLQCHVIRGFTFWRDEKNAEQIAEAVAVYRQILPLLQDSPIRIAIESEPSVTTHNIHVLDQFLAELNDAKVGALYDPGNEIADHAQELPYPAGYERIQPRLMHVHLKDIQATAEGYNPVALGEGDVDFHGLLARLKTDGYAGYVSVETHYRIQRLDESILVRPQGTAFSDGGYEASELYLRRLRDQYRWQE